MKMERQELEEITSDKERTRLGRMMSSLFRALGISVVFYSIMYGGGMSAASGSLNFEALAGMVSGSLVLTLTVPAVAALLLGMIFQRLKWSIVAFELLVYFILIAQPLGYFASIVKVGGSN